jgi:hypothetical protein
MNSSVGDRNAFLAIGAMTDLLADEANRRGTPLAIDRTTARDTTAVLVAAVAVDGIAIDTLKVERSIGVNRLLDATTRVVAATSR